MNDIGPRYDSKPTQPKDPGEMSREEEDALFDATLERKEIAASVWESIIDEISPELAETIVNVLFRKSFNGRRTGDFMEAGRLIHQACYKRVDKIVEGETHNTDMSKD